MGTVSRGVKTAGGGSTNFSTGKGTILSAEVDNDFNTLYTLVNGNLDTANLAADSVGNSELAPSAVTDTEVSGAAAARIAPTKINDTSSDDAAQRVTQDPGTFTTQINAEDLEDEIQQLRYAVQRLAVGLAADTGADAGTVGWYDPPGRGRNLIYNGGFSITDDRASGDAALPVGWTAIGNETLALTTDADTGDGNVLQITDDGSTGGGVQQTIDGLKKGTAYIIGCLAECTSGTFTLATTGAATTQLAVTTTSTTMAAVAGVFLTDSTPTNIVVKLTATAASDIVRVRDVYCFECVDDLATPPSRHTYRIDVTGDSGPQTLGATWANIDDGTDDLSITVMPIPGMQINVKAKVVLQCTATSGIAGIRILEDGTAKDASITHLSSAGPSSFDTLFCEWTNVAPTPGTALTYTLQGAAAAGTTKVGDSAALDSQDTVCWLQVETLFP